MPTLSFVPIPVYLLRKIHSHDDYGTPRYRYEAGFYSPETRGEYAEEVEFPFWWQMVLEHHQHIIYLEATDYYSFDNIAAEADAIARYELAMQQAKDAQYDWMMETDEHYAAFLAGAR